MSDVPVTLDGVLAAVRALRADPAIAPFLPSRDTPIPPADGDDPPPTIAEVYDTREDAYHGGMADSLAWLEDRGLLTPAQRAHAYAAMQWPAAYAAEDRSPDDRPPAATIDRDDPEYRRGYARGGVHADRIANINTAHWVHDKSDAYLAGYLDGLADGFATWLRFAAIEARHARAVRDQVRAEFERCRRCGRIRARCAGDDHDFLGDGTFPIWAPPA